MISSEPNGPLLVLDGPWAGRVMAHHDDVLVAVVLDDQPPVDLWSEIRPVSCQRVYYYKAKVALGHPHHGAPVTRYFWSTNLGISPVGVADALISLAARAEESQ